MAGKTIVLFVGFKPTYGLNGEPSPANQALESPAVEEEAMHIATTPLAILLAPGRKLAPTGAEEGRPPGSAEPGRRPLGLPFGTAHCQEGLCLEGQGKVPRDYAKAYDGRTLPKGCRRSPLRRFDASDAHGRGNAARLHCEEQKW